MSGKLLQQARIDAKKIATKGGFEEDITLTKGELSVQLKGLTSGITERYDTEGNPVYSPSFHCTIAEQDLITTEFPYLNTANRVALKGCTVKIPDNNGTLKEFAINETLPNKTTGLIICILGRKQ